MKTYHLFYREIELDAIIEENAEYSNLSGGFQAAHRQNNSRAGDPSISIFIVKASSLLLLLTCLACLTISLHAAPEKSAHSRHTVILRYEDFAPQAAAYQLIGFEWYQWNTQGPDKPGHRDDVKVVVYRDIPLEQVKRQYPLIPKRQDYRYISYDSALQYCARTLGECSACTNLKHTSTVIRDQLGK